MEAGRSDCNHTFIETAKEWKENGWQYYGVVKWCQTCGREELCGGTILVPEGGDFFGGEYTLEPDGSRGSLIS